MAHDCLKRAINLDGVGVPILVTRIADDSASRRIAALCGKHSVEVVDTHDPNSAEALRAIRMADPDAIFNINGFSILKDELISLPCLGVVNFHNGPLPRYAGLNIPTWVIWNGETRHGVTWHFVDRGIDTGDVIAQSMFELDERETAATLTMKCILHGIDMFKAVLVDVLSGTARREKQSDGRTYYRAGDIPNGGFIDFDWPAAQVERLLRALDFHPFANQLGHPRIRRGDSYISVSAARVLEECGVTGGKLPGTIAEIDEESISFSINDGRLLVRSFVHPDGTTMNVSQAVEEYGLACGMRLS